MSTVLEVIFVIDLFRNWKSKIIVGVVVSLGALSILLLDLTNSDQPTSCPNAEREFIFMMLPSLLDFEIVTTSDFGTSGHNPILPTANQAPDSSEFLLPVPKESGGLDFVAVTLEQTQFSNIYGGAIVDAENSIVSLSIHSPSDDTGLGGEIAGYVLKDFTREESSEGSSPSNNWYFYEPLRPLLEANIFAERPDNSCKEVDMNEFLSPKEAGDENVFIIYEARNTSFVIDLDPYMVEGNYPHTRGVTASSFSLQDNQIARRRANLQGPSQAANDCVSQSCKLNINVIFDDEYSRMRSINTSMTQTDLEDRIRRDLDGLHSTILSGPVENIFTLFDNPDFRSRLKVDVAPKTPKPLTK